MMESSRPIDRNVTFRLIQFDRAAYKHYIIHTNRTCKKPRAEDIPTEPPEEI